MNRADVVFVFNKNYIGRFKVTVFSLIKNNSGLKFYVHMLYDGLTEEDKTDVSSFIENYGAVPLLYEVDISLFSGLPKMPGDESYSTYKKLLIPELLQISNKVLYLDCDIIVRGDVSPLFDERDCPFISATEDIRVNLKRKEHVEQITGDKNNIYFNAGVMLFNLARRDECVSKETACSYMAENSAILRYHDQDMFNHFYCNNYALLDGKYDYMTTFQSVSDMFFPKGKRKAIILHYANWKPWNENYVGRFYGEYKKYYKLCRAEKGVDFLKKRKLSAQLKLIFSYIFKRER